MNSLICCLAYLSDDQSFSASSRITIFCHFTTCTRRYWEGRRHMCHVSRQWAMWAWLGNVVDLWLTINYEVWATSTTLSINYHRLLPAWCSFILIITIRLNGITIINNHYTRPNIQTALLKTHWPWANNDKASYYYCYYHFSFIITICHCHYHCHYYYHHCHHHHILPIIHTIVITIITGIIVLY